MNHLIPAAATSIVGRVRTTDRGALILVGSYPNARLKRGIERREKDPTFQNRIFALSHLSKNRAKSKENLAQFCRFDGQPTNVAKYYYVAQH